MKVKTIPCCILWFIFHLWVFKLFLLFLFFTQISLPPKFGNLSLHAALLLNYSLHIVRPRLNQYSVKVFVSNSVIKFAV